MPFNWTTYFQIFLFPHKKTTEIYDNVITFARYNVKTKEIINLPYPFHDPEESLYSLEDEKV